MAGTSQGLRAGHIQFDCGGVVTGFSRVGVVAQQVCAPQFDTNGGDRIFQFFLLAEMKLRSSRGRRQDREGIGMLFGVTAAPEDRNQIAEIHTAPETASFTPGNSLKRESIRHKRLAELW